MANKKTDTTSSLELTPEETQAILAARQRQAGGEPSVAINDLAQALVLAINQTKPKDKIKPYQRKKICKRCGKDHRENTPLKRSWFQHGGIELNPLNYCEETIALLNQVKPGSYVGGLIQVRKRRDRAYDIAWPVRTNAQRLRVINEAGATFEAILKRCIEEANDPRRFRGPDDDD